ncbi:hypothetical protein [Alicyclobacillus sp. ALC3]|uniref:hypothetical protein n=1 Tax=Alicyclobacillus sp. ALC3 TaxID=2796143 RepID=UPI0023792276|nr:hypothetical protein [Alicyclobacillus sp. ALC3]WDL96662.1 hypothetical protein JC200_20525 [Alicyclobacillus sp. ALC3]
MGVQTSSVLADSQRQGLEGAVDQAGYLKRCLFFYPGFTFVAEYGVSSARLHGMSVISWHVEHVIVIPEGVTWIKSGQITE